jgi:DNA-binding response OmpR family regulator
MRSKEAHAIMPLEVLLVEDNAGDAVLTRQVLAEGKTPVNLHIACDGEQALWMLDSPDFKADLIILDLVLPRVSGLMVLERNKRKSTPVVIFSSSGREPEIKRALRAGAREYIKKPSDLDEFTVALTAIITKWGSTAP